MGAMTPKTRFTCHRCDEEGLTEEEYLEHMRSGCTDEDDGTDDGATIERI